MSRLLYAIEDIFDQAAFDARNQRWRVLLRKLSKVSGAYADRIKRWF